MKTTTIISAAVAVTPLLAAAHPAGAQQLGTVVARETWGEGDAVAAARDDSLAFPDTPADSVRMRPGTVFQDCAACPEMVVVPAGTFMMGSPASEDGRDDVEGPQHAVTISARRLRSGCTR